MWWIKRKAVEKRRAKYLLMVLVIDMIDISIQIAKDQYQVKEIYAIFNMQYAIRINKKYNLDSEPRWFG
jgi:hypothetical protein